MDLLIKELEKFEEALETLKKNVDATTKSEIDELIQEIIRPKILELENKATQIL